MQFLRHLRRLFLGESSIFGMPLSVVRSRSGLSLPRSILELMHFLRTSVADTVGIFRKNGVRSRIAELRAKCDVDPYEEVFPDSKGLDPLQVARLLHLLLTLLGEVELMGKRRVKYGMVVSVTLVFFLLQQFSNKQHFF